MAVPGNLGNLLPLNVLDYRSARNETAKNHTMLMYPTQHTIAGPETAGLKHQFLDIIRRITSQRWDASKSFKPLVVSKADADEHGMKRLFVCCDGTWKNAAGTIAAPTNVARLARSVDRHGVDDIQAVPQVVYYVGGVGTTSVLPVPIDYLYSGLTGEGLQRSILEAYCFLCNNYNFASEKDEIILVGFSRGAFAVRCLASFITEVGLIRRKHLSLLPTVFENWCQGKGKVDPKYREARISLAVRIRVLAEWDTVSALWGQKFGFIQGEVPSAVDNAFLAIALDERRLSFQPMLWTGRGHPVERWVSKNPEQRVEQCLFNGHHGDIGGGNFDAGLSTIALLWMISRIESVSNADFDRGALLQSILPLPSSSVKDGDLENPSTPDLKYENLLMSKGHVNPPSWWWSLQHYLAFNLFDGDRYQWLNHTSREKHDLKDTLKVHFTVPLLKEGAVKERSVDTSLPRKIRLWDRAEFAWQDPERGEIELWKRWKNEAERWKPDRHSEEDDMEDWGTIIDKLNMKAVEREGDKPVVFRVYEGMRKQSSHLCKLFDEPFEGPGAKQLSE
ncbi:hypothetical protein F4809DRAFT_646875 [Biscogniauxia mediterranea]|nr:hypothetical protein F4809DRAFT_646875 [Biscogniauxia mediterranea]